MQTSTALDSVSESVPGLDPERLRTLVGAVQSDIDDGLHRGAALLVSRHGRVGLRAAIGVVDSDNRAARTDDVYLLASVTKAFTAAAVLRAVDSGALSLDTTAASLLPGFAVRGKKRITLRHLLTHAGGLYYGFNLPESLSPFGGPDLDFAVQQVSQIPINSRPGQRVSYSPWEGYAVLGEVLRVADGGSRSYSAVMRDEVFAPLRMTESSIGRAVDDPRRVPFEVIHPSGAAQPADAMSAMNYLGENCEMPGVSAYAPIADVHKFIEMVGGRGLTPDGTRYLSHGLAEYAYRNHTGEQTNDFWDFDLEQRDWPSFPANFALGGGYSRGDGAHSELTPNGITSSSRAFAAVGAGTTMAMADPEIGLGFVFLSSGIVEGLAHFRRLQRLSDLAIAACT